MLTLIFLKIPAVLIFQGYQVHFPNIFISGADKYHNNPWDECDSQDGKIHIQLYYN